MSDIEVHLVYGKHTRSIKVSIDSRCKVVNFEENYPELKHTIWWKGLFVSDIHILCNDFVVKLHKNNFLLSTSINADFLVKNVANKDCIICENEEALNKEQIEEIKEILVSFSNNQKVTSTELDLYVLKLLYCYILPSVVFMHTDLDWLHSCLKLVEDELQKVDADLIKDDKHLVKFAIKLREKRAVFLNLPEEQKENLLKTNNNFLNTILSHFHEDCRSLEEVYNKCRARVQDRKVLLKKKSMAQEYVERDESDIERDLYFEREESHRILEEMVALKINIANIEYIKGEERALHKKKDMKDALSLLHSYLELHELRESLKKKVKDSCLDKIRLKSIAESIKMVIQDVEVFGESLGIESANKEEWKSVNELGPTCWQNCAEKIKCLLNDPSQYLAQLHFSYKEELHLKISSLLSEQSLFQENSVDTRNHKRNCDLISTKSQESIIFNPFPDNWEGIIQQLKDRINEQIIKMCEMIKCSALVLEKSEQKQIPKIYENILLTEIMNDMCKLFEMALKSYCKEIYSRISSLSYNELMENMFFLVVERKDSDNKSILNPVLSRKKKSFRIPQYKSISLPDFSKEVSKISISIPQEKKKIQNRRTSYTLSLTDSISSAFIKGSVSSLYKEADREYRDFCKAKAQPIAMDEVEFSSPKEKNKKKQPISRENAKDFLDSFRPSLLSIEKIFSSSTLQEKLNCMVRTLKCISYSIIHAENRLVTADDLIAILSVLFYSLTEEQLKRLCWELALVNTFMHKDEKIGINGNALVHFMCALEALYRQTDTETNTF